MSKSVTREYLETLLIVVIFALFARTFVFGQFKIPSGSMMETLLIGDYLLVNRFVFAENWSTPGHDALLPYRDLERGDIVVFKDPKAPRRDLIKRCVALEGDRVQVVAKTLFINGRAVDEPYAQHIYGGVGSFGPFVVPEGKIFCMGDNRDNSHDSRFFGPVQKDSIKGRAMIIYWSWEADRDDWEWKGIWQWVVSKRQVLTKARWKRVGRLIR